MFVCACVCVYMKHVEYISWLCIDKWNKIKIIRSLVKHITHTLNIYCIYTYTYIFLEKMHDGNPFFLMFIYPFFNVLWVRIFILNKPEYVFQKLRNICGLIPLSLCQKGNWGLWNNPWKVKSSPVAELRLTPVPPDLVIFPSTAVSPMWTDWVLNQSNWLNAAGKVKAPKSI